MNQAEQMNVLSSTGINSLGNNIEIEDDYLNRYRKQAKKYFRNKH